MQRLLGRGLLVLTFIGMVTLSACAPGTQHESERGPMSESTPEKHGDGKLRTDLEPIAKRYPQVIAATSVHWMSGTVGTSDLGPSTYWIDAVVVLPADEVRSLLALGESESVDAPVLARGLSSFMPTGPFVGGAALDRLFSAHGYPATIAIDPASNIVVIRALFDSA